MLLQVLSCTADPYLYNPMFGMVSYQDNLFLARWLDNTEVFKAPRLGDHVYVSIKSWMEIYSVSLRFIVLSSTHILKIFPTKVILEKQEN